MTGAELPAAAVGVGKALANVAKDDDSLKAQLREKAKDSPAMLAASEAHAKRVAVKQEMLLKLFMPLAVMLGISRDYFQSDFGKDMAEKVKDIPEENLVPPKPSIAGPVMQGLGYSLDESDLKDMYLNLLTTAVDGRQTDNAHPSFAEVIRQLSSEEAGLLKVTLSGVWTAMIRITSQDPDSETGGYSILQSHVVDWSVAGEPFEHPSMAVYIDNWVRLGLVTVHYDGWLTTPGVYDWIESRPELKRHRAKHELENVMIAYDRGYLAPTAFGIRFMSAVTAAPAGQPLPDADSATPSPSEQPEDADRS